jgi:hypothetical protein
VCVCVCVAGVGDDQNSTHTGISEDGSQYRVVSFERRGPLHMEIDDRFQVIRVEPGGQADLMGVRMGFKMVAFNGVSTLNTTLNICMNNVRLTPRPWAFTFLVPAGDYRHPYGTISYAGAQVSAEQRQEALNGVHVRAF